MGATRCLSILKFSAFLCNSFVIITSLTYELFVIFPAINDFGILYFVSAIFQIFFCFNVLANLWACEMVDTSIQTLTLRPTGDSLLHPTWHFCRKCATLVPPRTWHCDICKTCILRHDHHCAFVGCCIGSKNGRYFIMFLFYAALCCLFTALNSTYYIWWLHYETYGNFETVLKLLFPFLLFWPINWSSAFLLTYLVNIYFGTISAGFLIAFLKCVVRGATTDEYRKQYFAYDLGSCKSNLETILGRNMYLIWLSPFIQSKLKDNCLEFENTAESIQMTPLQ